MLQIINQFITLIILPPFYHQPNALPKKKIVTNIKIINAISASCWAFLPFNSRFNNFNLSSQLHMFLIIIDFFFNVSNFSVVFVNLLDITCELRETPAKAMPITPVIRRGS